MKLSILWMVSVFFAGCSDLKKQSAPPIKKTIYGSAALGPLSKSKVSVYRFSDLLLLNKNTITTNELTYSMVSTSTGMLYKSATVGEYKAELLVPAKMSEDELIMIVMTGGKDIDPNDDHKINPQEFQSLKGEVIAITTLGELYTKNVVVNAISTFAAHTIQDIPKKDISKVKNQLTKIARLFLETRKFDASEIGDLNQDHIVDFKDIALFNPKIQGTDFIRQHDRHLKNRALYLDLLPDQTDTITFTESLFNNDLTSQNLIVQNYFLQTHKIPLTIEDMMALAGDQASNTLNSQDINSIVGVFGATEENLLFYQTLLLSGQSEDFDSVEKINSLIKTINKLLSQETLLNEDSLMLGLLISPSELNDLNKIIANSPVSGFNSPNKLNSLISTIRLPVISIPDASAQQGSLLQFIIATSKTPSQASLFCQTTEQGSAEAGVHFTSNQSQLTQFVNQQTLFEVPTLEHSNADTQTISISCGSLINLRLENILDNTIVAIGAITKTLPPESPPSTDLIPDRSYGDGLHDFNYSTVTSPLTGKTWLSHNLGADYANTNHEAYDPKAVAKNINDSHALGSLFQWGRSADGHEIINRETNTPRTDDHSPIQTDFPGHDVFISTSNTPHDWRNTANSALWSQNLNLVCPENYRLPSKIEWENEVNSWSAKNQIEAFNSPLKLTSAGYRKYGNGDTANAGKSGYYWSQETIDEKSSSFYLSATRASFYNRFRAYGYAVRCIKK